MGLYSRLHAAVDRCPSCGYGGDRVIQFQYGDVRLQDYRLGDELRWETNIIGEPGHKRVLVSGFLEPCPKCRADDDRLYRVQIDHDRLTAVAPIASPSDEIAIFGPTGARVED